MDKYITDWTISFKNGDTLEFNDVFRRYYRPLCYFANEIVGDLPEAEDIVTESFIKLLHTTLKGNNPSELRSFLFTVTRNSCIDHLRKQKKTEQVFKEMSLSQSNVDAFTEEQMIVAQTLQQVFEEIEQLPDQCRRVFKGFYIEKKDTETISTEMGISKQTVLNHKSRALLLLKQSLLRKGVPGYMILLYFLGKHLG